MKKVKTKTISGIYYDGFLSDTQRRDKIIIHIHGMQSYPNKDTYIPVMHEFYPENKIAFLTVEHRGTGVETEFESNRGKIVIGGAHEIFEDCVEDIGAWINFAREAGYKEIWLQAHSLGTPKIAYYVANSNSCEVFGLILLSPSEMIGLVHDAEGQLDFDVMYPEAKRLDKEGKPGSILTHKLWGENPMSAKTFLNFFEKGANTAVFNYANPSWGWDTVNKIKVPTLAITGTLDDGIMTVMDARQGMTLLERELKNSPMVKTIVYEGAKHGFVGFEDKIVNDVVKFVNSKFFL